MACHLFFLSDRFLNFLASVQASNSSGGYGSVPVFQPKRSFMSIPVVLSSKRTSLAENRQAARKLLNNFFWRRINDGEQPKNSLSNAQRAYATTASPTAAR